MLQKRPFWRLGFYFSTSPKNNTFQISSFFQDISFALWLKRFFWKILRWSIIALLRNSLLLLFVFPSIIRPWSIVGTKVGRPFMDSCDFSTSFSQSQKRRCLLCQIHSKAFFSKFEAALFLKFFFNRERLSYRVMTASNAQRS